MLTLNLPTNRSLRDSRTAIDAAVNFSLQTGARLIIVNSNHDPEKIEYLRRIESNIDFAKCIINDPKNSNLEIAARQKQMGFSAFLADDDILYCLRLFNAEVLSEVPASIVGIIPQVQIFSKNGIEKINRINSGADGEINPRHFGASSSGANTGLYGWYRSEVWVAGMLAATRSPSFKVGVFDWPFSLAMSCLGAVATDNNTVYAYDISNWKGDPSFVNKQVEELFVAAGFDKGLAKVLGRIKLLDFFVILSGIQSSLGVGVKEEVIDAATMCLCGLLLTRKNVAESIDRIGEIDSSFAYRFESVLPKF